MMQQALTINFGHHEVIVWDQPVAGESYALGADVSEGLENGDDSAACVLKASSGEQVAEYVGQIDDDEFGVLLWLLGRYYNNAYLGVENNVILTPIAILRNLEYDNLHYEWVWRGEPVEGRKEKIGWNTNALTRPKLITDARRGLKESTLFIRSSIILDQMSVFQRNRRGRFEHIKGAKDDAVFAWMIAIQMLEYMFVADDLRGEGLLPQRAVAEDHVGDPNLGLFAETFEEDEAEGDILSRALKRQKEENVASTMMGMGL